MQSRLILRGLPLSNQRQAILELQGERKFAGIQGVARTRSALFSSMFFPDLFLLHVNPFAWVLSFSAPCSVLALAACPKGLRPCCCLALFLAFLAAAAQSEEGSDSLDELMDQRALVAWQHFLETPPLMHLLSQTQSRRVQRVVMFPMGS